MTCSISVNRKKGLHEVKYVPDEEFPNYEDEEITRSIHYFYDEENDEEFDVEFILNDLYRKVGILRLRIEQLEAR